MLQTNFVEKIKKQFSIEYIFFENRAVYDIMWKNMLDPDRLLMENNKTQKRHDFRAG